MSSGGDFYRSAFGTVEELGCIHGDAPGTSMYVELFEEMLDTVLQHESFLLSPLEIQFLDHYRHLSVHARYLLLRLCLRKSGKWFRQCNLESQYSGDLGPYTKDAMVELSKSQIAVPVDSANEPSRILRFARLDNEASVEELVDCLQLEELKGLIQKNRASKHATSKADLRASLLSHSSTQTVLSFAPSVRRSSDLELLSGMQTVKSVNLRRQILEISTRCIRIDDFTVGLFSRLNLIYLRSTTLAQAEALLLPSVLNRSYKRLYPRYSHRRTSTIFPSRDALLAYESALRVEASVDVAMTAKPDKEDNRYLENKARFRARIIRGIWEKHWDSWAALVAAHGNTARLTNFERFEPGHILTRVIYKGAESLGTLGEYDLEVEVLKALLSQTRWRRGKRGAWWERLALVYMNHMIGNEEENRRKALTAVKEGLDDPFTHLKYRPTLERRMKRLESLLKLDRTDRRKIQYKQEKPQTRTIKGIRIWERPLSSHVPKKQTRSALCDILAVNQHTLANKKSASTKEGFTENSQDPLAKEVTLAWRRGKSIWKGQQGEEVTVERLALQHYSTLDFKGVHSEGRIIGCLFTLLFWDILFAPISGAFETPYQTAPLDLWEDTFYYAREDMIKERVEELRSDKAMQILAQVDLEERSRNTWCIGVHWDDFTRNDLLEIVECMGGKPLAAVCSVLAKDYSLSTAGVPDLFVWNPKEKRCIFAEVKGPDDALQENQRVWIDILVRAGFPVELCKVEEEDIFVSLVKPTEAEQGTKKRRRYSEPNRGKVESICLLSEEETDAVEVEPSREEQVFVHKLSPPRKRKRRSI